MAKLIIAIDIGECKEDDIIVNTPDIDTDDINYFEYMPMNLRVLKPGIEICFDEAYLRKDKIDDNFFVAEFRGWED